MSFNVEILIIIVIQHIPGLHIPRTAHPSTLLVYPFLKTRIVIILLPGLIHAFLRRVWSHQEALKPLDTELMHQVLGQFLTQLLEGGLMDKRWRAAGCRTLVGLSQQNNPGL